MWRVGVLDLPSDSAIMDRPVLSRYIGYSRPKMNSGNSYICLNCVAVSIKYSECVFSGPFISFNEL